MPGRLNIKIITKGELYFSSLDKDTEIEIHSRHKKTTA